MDSPLTLYSLALSLAMVLSLGLAFMAFFRLKVPGALAFLFGNLAGFLYAFGSLIEITAQTPQQALTSLTVEYLGIATIGPFLFLTAIAATRGAGVVSPFRSLLLFIVPAIVILTVATNPYHYLFYTSFEVRQNGPFTVPLMGKGPFYFLNLVYMNLCLAWGALTLLREALKAPAARRKPLLVFFFASLLPWSGMAVYLLGLSPWGLDTAPFGLALSGLLFAVALFRYGLFDLMPLVLDQVFENMKEGVLVVDQKNRLIGMNPAVMHLFRLTDKGVGRDLATLGLPELRREGDLKWTLGDQPKTFQVDRSPLLDKKGNLQGEIFMLLDITLREELAEKLSRMARVDELTALPNRRAFLERLRSEADRLHRYGDIFSLAIADIDHFKKVNDTWGHDAGDAALVHVSRLWSTMLRGSDLLARYGGEEFTVLMAETPEEEARLLLERMRAQLEAQPLLWQGQTIRLTASFGTTSVLLFDDEDLDSWIRRADLALYRAKESGRNQVQGAL